MIKSTHQINYESGQYPECYRPCPPFYMICNHGSHVLISKFITKLKDRYSQKQIDKCEVCFAKNQFKDSIE